MRSPREAFLRRSINPLFSPMTKENAATFAMEGHAVLIYFVDGEAPSDAERKLFTNFAAKVRTNIMPELFVVWMETDFMAVFKNYMGLLLHDPAIGIYAFGEDRTYHMLHSGELTTAALEKYAKDFKKGKLEPFIKSEPVSANDESRPLKRVVTTTWKEIVENPAKDVLVLLYNPWGKEYIKQLRKMMSFAEATLHNEKTFTAAFMDASKNLPPIAYRSNSYPTFWLFPAGKRQKDQKGVQFMEDIGHEGVVRFLKDNCKHEFFATEHEKLLAFNEEMALEAKGKKRRPVKADEASPEVRREVLKFRARMEARTQALESPHDEL